MTNGAALTATQKRLQDAMVTAAKEGRWQVLNTSYGLTIRWDSQEKVAPPQMLDSNGRIGGWPGTTPYRSHVFLSMTPRPILGTSPAPWVARRDTQITYTLAMAILEDPARALT
jgi:hypothetical protein